MMIYTRILILLVLLTARCGLHTAFSQSIENYPWQENNLFLTERAQCIELLDNANKKIGVKDSLLELQRYELVEKDKQIVLVEENYNLSEQRYHTFLYQLSECNMDKEKVEKERDKEKGRKKFWRGVSIITTAIAVATVLIATN